MAGIDSLIASGGQKIDLAGPIREFQDRKRRDKQDVAQAAQLERVNESRDIVDNANREKAAQARFDSFDARDQSRLTSTVQGAAQINQALQNNDIEAVRTNLTNRKRQIGADIAVGRDVDTTETDQALAFLDSAEGIEQLKQISSQAVTFGQQAGILKRPGGDTAAPSAVREFEFFENLDESEQGRFLNVKRNTLAPGTQLDAQGKVVEIQDFGTTVGGIESAKAKGKAEGKVEGDVLPEKIQLKQDDLIDEISLSTTIQTDLEAFTGQIDSGDLNLNVVGNATDNLRNKLSLSTEESRNLQSFNAFVAKLRNDSLRLNKGIQTEGDAERALDELVNSANDPGVVRQRLQEIAAINEKAANIKNLRLQLLREENRKTKLDITPFVDAASKSAFDKTQSGLDDAEEEEFQKLKAELGR